MCNKGWLGEDITGRKLHCQGYTNALFLAIWHKMNPQLLKDKMCLFPLLKIAPPPRPAPAARRAPPPPTGLLINCIRRAQNHFFFFHGVNELYVDDPDKDSGGKIEVSLNISLPNLHCDCEYIRNIYIYTTLTFFAQHFLFVCFTLFVAYGCLFPPYQTVSYLTLSSSTAYW